MVRIGNFKNCSAEPNGALLISILMSPVALYIVLGLRNFPLVCTSMLPSRM